MNTMNIVWLLNTYKRSLTILLFVTMGDQNISGLLHPQIEKFHRLFAILVNFEDLVF